jgi:hypothetical protein
MASFGEFVHDNHDHIPFPFSRDWKRSGEIHCNCVLPFRRDCQWLVEAISLVTGLVSLTNIAGSDVILDVAGQARPVEEFRYGGRSSGNSEVPRNLRIIGNHE